MNLSRLFLRLIFRFLILILLLSGVLTTATLVTARILPAGWVVMVAVRQSERSRDRYNHLYLIDVQHCRQHPLDVFSMDDSLAWSPDGEQIAFVSTLTGGLELHVSDWRGVYDRQVTFGLGTVTQPSFSPQSDQLAFTVLNLNEFDIYRLDLSRAAPPIPLTGAGTVDVTPTFAPDGSQIVYTANVGATSHIHALDLVDGTVERINDTDEDRWVFEPAYSPDSRQIAFITNSSNFNDYRLHIMNADGTDSRMIAQAGMDTTISKPAFSPDGESLAVIYAPEQGSPMLYAVDTNGIGWHRVPCTPERIAAFAFRPL